MSLCGRYVKYMTYAYTCNPQPFNGLLTQAHLFLYCYGALAALCTVLPVINI